jgi:hypothetical protein
MANRKSDPGAAKYQSNFQSFVQANLKVPKNTIKEAEAESVNIPSPKLTRKTKQPK